MRKRIFEIIQIGQVSDRISRGFDYFIMANIILNILVVILDTFDELSAYNQIFRWIEIITTIVFLVEYILRIWTADLLYPRMSRGKAVGRFIMSFDGIVDLFTIIPVFFLSGAVAFRMLRVVRILHLFRINSKYDSFHAILSIIYKKKAQLASSLFIIFILMLASSICMYSAEHEAQPEVFKNAFSGFWWSVTTILTIGYGDIYPVTIAGTIIAIIMSFLGVGAVAIPTGIISAGFVEQYEKEKNSEKRFMDLKEIGEIVVGKRSDLKGRTIREIWGEYGMEVYLVMRDDLSAIPDGNLKVQQGDILIVRSDKVMKSKA
ncbi:MAG: ion transporter [Clostridia bacterium]|nr:ion transporter [Clostridia bacterium]